jgi:hypothetical protein
MDTLILAAITSTLVMGLLVYAAVAEAKYHNERWRLGLAVKALQDVREQAATFDTNGATGAWMIAAGVLRRLDAEPGAVKRLLHDAGCEPETEDGEKAA